MFPLTSITLSERATTIKKENEVYITILTPPHKRAEKLMKDWKRVISKEKEYEDSKIKNASSISILIEYNEQKLLMTGDAEIMDILTALKTIFGTAAINITLMKLPHHGAKNCINDEFLKSVNCTNFIVSTNGNAYHPHPETLLEIAKRHKMQAQIFCNYDISSRIAELELKQICDFPEKDSNTSLDIDLERCTIR